MKNLFDFATKELSQDAFLRWLFESYNDNDLQYSIRILLAEFCDLQDDEEIKSIKTWAQRAKIDISVWIDTNKRNISLFIEDKAFTGEHNQLLKYNNKIDKYKDREIYKVFYRTSLLSSWDKEATSVANWKSYGIIELSNIYQKCKETNNVILQQYINYLQNISLLVQNTKKPLTSNGREDWLKWESYFNTIILPNFKSHYPQSWAGKAGQYPYVILKIQKERCSPYLEIRSRSCCNNDFTALILCYGITDFSPQQSIIEKIYADEFFECKYLRHKNGATPKQIGKYVTHDIDTDEKFIAEITRCIEYYSEILILWDEYSS